MSCSGAVANIFVIGDPHIKNSNAIQTEALKNTIADIIQRRNEEMDAVVVLGDILDRHDRVDIHPLSRATSFLAAIRDALPQPKPLWILIGNHDRPNNSVFMTDEHAFNALKKWQNTVVADETIEVLTLGEVPFLLVPYVPKGRFQEAVGTEFGDVVGVFAHQEFRGAPLGSIKSLDGDVYPTDAPYCVSGHIHEMCQLASNVFYTGTPYSVGWGSKDGAVFLISYDGHGGVLKREKIVISEIPRNETRIFTSPEAFISSTTENIFKTTSCSSSLIRAKVCVQSMDEFTALIANSSKCKELEAAGVSVIPIVVVAASSKRGGGEEKGEVVTTTSSSSSGGVPFIERLRMELKQSEYTEGVAIFLERALGVSSLLTVA
jgi:hypothetical protein